MTLHSSFYAFSACSLKKCFMAGLCSIVINYPTHWHTTGQGSLVKLYYDWDGVGGQRDRQTCPSLVFLTVSFLSPLVPGILALL